MYTPTKVVNVYDSALPSVSISREFDLDRIDLQVLKLEPGQDAKGHHPKGTTTVIYVLKGSASASVVGIEERKDISKDHLFVLAPKDAEVDYVVKAGEDGVTVFVARDINSEKAEYNDEKATPSPPKILDAYALTKFTGKGMDSSTMAYLTRLADPRKKDVDDDRWWNVNIERMPPGTQASWAHCHSAEDELVLVLSGTGRYYHHGEEPEHILKPGDVIGWKAGTGIMHTLLNDGQENGGGEELVFLCWGEYLPGFDKCAYVSRDPETYKDYAWINYPKHPLGKAYDLPRFPRKDAEPTQK